MRRFLALLLVLAAAAGCEQPRLPPTPPITNFAVQLDQGLLSHDIRLTHQSIVTLSAVHLTITVLTERDRQTVERHWGQWLTAETKVINVPASGGLIQEINISGTAKQGLDQEPVALEAAWTFSYGNRP